MTASRRRICAVATLLMLGLPAAVAVAGETTSITPRRIEQDNDWTYGLSLYPEYSEGTFGTRHTTQILYAPLISEWSPTDRLDVRLTIPFLWERGHDILALVGGGTARDAQRVRVRRTPRMTVVSEAGLGDVLLEAEYVVLDDRGLVPEIAPFAEVKFPTADSSRGLGTGQFDETLGVSVSKSFGGGFTGGVELWYTFVGSPSHVHLDNSFGWELSLGYRISPALQVTGYVQGETAVAVQGDNPLNVRAEAEYRLTKILSALGSAGAGLNPASPNFTFSAGLRVRF